MKIGIIGAMDVEIDILKQNITQYRQTTIGGCVYYDGFIGDTKCVLVKCGIGKVNASICATTLLNNYEVDMIINTGIAGGVSPLMRRDVVLATKLSYSDVDVSVFGYKIGQIPGAPRYFSVSDGHLSKVKSILNKEEVNYKIGNVLTSDKFCTSLDEIQPFLTTDLTAVEMEGASIAHVCHNYCIPFISLRYISDIIGADNQEQDYLEFEREMAKNSALICLKIIKNYN